MVELRIYGRSMILAGESSAEIQGGSWQRLPLPAAFLAEASSGIYYYSLRLEASKGRGIVGKFMVLK
jgi:hypothetical protein